MIRTRAAVAGALAVLFYVALSPLLTTPQNSVVRGVRIGEDRYRYLLEFPAGTPDGPVPLIVALHGYGGDVGQFRAESGLWQMTARGYAVLFVQALLDGRDVTHWNAGLHLSARDDTAGLAGVIAQVRDRFGYDPARIAVVGYSNGGFMAFRLACRTQGVVQAIIVVNGTMSGDDWANCPYRGSVPLMQWTGLADDVVPSDGSMTDEDGWGGAPPVAQVVATWAGSGAEATGTDTRQYRAPDGALRAEYRALPGIGHDWPGPDYLGRDILTDIDAFLNEVMAP